MSDDEVEATSEDLAEALVRAWPIGLALFDGDGRITHLNDAFAEVLELGRETMVGRTVADLAPGSEIAAAVATAMTGATPEPVDVERHGPSGTRRWEVTAHPVVVRGAALIAVRAQELTEQRAAEDRLRRRARHQGLIADLGRRALQTENDDELLDHTAAVAAEALLAPLAAVTQLERSRDLFVVRAGVGWEKGTVIPHAGQAAFTVERGEAVYCPDATNETRFTPNQVIFDRGIRSIATAVIDGPEDKPWGILSVHSPSVDAFSNDDLHVLAVIANIVGAALVRMVRERELKESEARRRLAMAAGRMGTWTWDVVTNKVEWDDSLQEVFGFTPGTFDGSFEQYLERIHPDDRDDVLRVLAEALVVAHAHEFEHRILLASGEQRWIAGRGDIVRDVSGAATGMVGIAADVSERKQADDEREKLRLSERAARQRLEFLAGASEILTHSLDLDQTLHGLAGLVIEGLADWCAIDLVDETGRNTSVVVAHADPGKVKLARDLRERYPTDPDSPTGAPAVLRSGNPVLYAELPPGLLEATARDDQHLRLLKSLGLISVMIVPLVSRSGAVLGTATFVSAESGRHFDEDDLALAAELGRRAGLAVESAQLFAERDHVARTLQASLLPPDRPDIAGLELSALYRPAAAGPVIGGDFYDFFEAEDGRWSVVIGDVCGKGADAAALTGLARHTIRAASMREPSPAAVLRDLNEVILRNDTVQRFCTVAIARLQRRDDRFTMTAACGGHPAPVVIRADGRVEVGECRGSLIGVMEDVELVDRSVELEPGDAVVFYTDGVTEARVNGKIFGEEGLVSLLRSIGPRHPDELAASVHDAVVDPVRGGTRDDVAIVVLRVDPVPSQDGLGPTAVEGTGVPTPTA